jgi:hypothetical protein
MIIRVYMVHANDTRIESGLILIAVDIIHEQNQRARTREIFMANLWQKGVTVCHATRVTP